MATHRYQAVSSVRDYCSVCGMSEAQHTGFNVPIRDVNLRGRMNELAGQLIAANFRVGLPQTNIIEFEFKGHQYQVVGH